MAFLLIPIRAAFSVGVRFAGSIGRFIEGRFLHGLGHGGGGGHRRGGGGSIDVSVRVTGLREVQRAFRAMGKEADKMVRDELKQVGDIVRADAAQRFESISPSSAAGYKVSVRQGSISVRQSKRKTTGKRPDFGTLQMRVALEPALAANEQQVVRALDAALDRLASKQGF
jgi:hypothetical protein